MPNRTIYISDQDLPKWEAIPKGERSDWVSNQLNPYRVNNHLETSIKISPEEIQERIDFGNALRKEMKKNDGRIPRVPTKCPTCNKYTCECKEEV